MFSQSSLDHVERKGVACADQDRLRIDLADACAIVEVPTDSIRTQRTDQVLSDPIARVALGARCLVASWGRVSGGPVSAIGATWSCREIKLERRGC